jgi:type II secretory pathway pseudopilin PulG
MLAHEQSGVALLVLLGLLGLIAALFVVGFAGNLTRQNEADERTANALAQAKEALIGYAANYPDEHAGRVFGYLPCPDRDGGTGEGTADTACGGADVTVIGRLPWKTLELPPLRDGNGECLWYAVSGNFKNNPPTDLMNWDTNGLITIVAPDGSNFVAGGSGSTAIPTRRAAAVIFAPGAILPGQDRSLAAVNPPTNCGGNYNAANYLDTDTASAINNASASSATSNALSKFISAFDSNRTAAATNTFNDRLIAITPDDIFLRRAEMRSDFLPYLTDPNPGMLRRAADCLVWFSQNNGSPINSADVRLPWAAPISLSNTGTAYGTATNYADSTLQYSGRLPYLVSVSASATNNSPVQGTGGRLLNQPPCPNLYWDATTDAFWSNWKEHVFYAVAEAYAPNSPSPTPANACALTECITVDGVPGFAAVVIFAGMKQSGQSRNNDANPAYTSADKSSAANYLEGVNATAILQNSPSLGAPRQFSKVGGNDTVMCISANPGTGLLYVDPTCSIPTSTCTSNANSLAGYKSGNSNNCKVGTKSVLAACQNLADTISSNNCSCKKPAKDFISKKCLDGFTDPKCLAAYTSLSAC